MAQFIFPPLTASLDSEQTNGGSLPTKQMVIAGYDSTATRVLLTDSAGRLEINAVVSLPLPSGAATAALQTAGNNILTTIDADTSILAGAVASGQMQVDIVADGAGLATTANQSTMITKLTSLDGKDFATAAKQDVIETTLTAIETDVDTSAGAVKNIQSAQGTTDAGIPALVVRNDTLADLSGADGDYSPLQVNATGALYTSLATAIPAGTNTIGNVTVDTYNVVDFIDSTVAGYVADNGVIVLSGTETIPAKASAQLQLVSTSAEIKKVQTVEDIGEFMGLYVGASTSESLVCVLPLGGGEVNVEIASGSRISIRALTSSTALTSGSLGINFLG